jgi:hypothetical protein
MRRAVLSVLIGWLGLASVAGADSWYGPRYPYHVYYSSCHTCPYGYKTHGYGKSLRGIVHGWYGLGPRYTPANGSAPNPLYFTQPAGPGQYVYSGSMRIEGTPMAVPQRSTIPPEVLNAPEPIDPPVAPYPTTKFPTE